MKPQPARARVTVGRLVSPFVLVVIVCAAAITALIAVAANGLNRVSIDNSIQLTRSVLAGIERDLAAIALDYSYWDQAVEKLVYALDVAWADANVGLYTYEAHGIQSMYVLDGDDRPVYAVVEGERRGENPHKRFAGGLATLVGRARATPPERPPVPAMGLLRDARGIHFVGASLFTDYVEEGGKLVDRPTRSVLLVTRPLDAGLLAELSRGYLLRGLRLLPAGAALPAAALPLAAADASLLGTLAWQPELPGRDMLVWTLPAVGAALAVVAGLALVFIRRATNTVRAFEAQNLALAHAKERAELADRAKTEFLATMSHELRTPLNSILGFSERLRDEALAASKVREYAKDVHDAGRHLADLVSDVFDVVAADMGRLTLHEGCVDVREVMESCRRLVLARAEANGVSIAIDAPAGLPPLRADETRLKQIVLNLLTNSVKFSHVGGEVILKAAVADDGMAISVADNGIGMVPEDIPKALTRFGRIGDSRTSVKGGTGLGLTIVQSLAALHGACLELASEPGMGTTATIRFPRQRCVTAGEETG